MRRHSISVLLTVCFLGVASTVLAQVPTLATPVQGSPPEDAPSLPQASTPNIGSRNPAKEPPSVWLWTQAIIAATLLIFAATMTCIVFKLVKEGKDVSDRVFKMYTINIVVFVGTLLIVIGFSDSQIAPMMGLLGTIIGYILGSPSNRNAATGPESAQDAERPQA